MANGNSVFKFFLHTTGLVHQRSEIACNREQSVQCDRGHRAHVVRGAGRTFEFGCQNGYKRKATVQVVCFANGRPFPARRYSHHTQMLRIHLFLSYTALCASVIAYEIKNNLKILFRLRVVEATGLEPVTSRM